MAAININDMKEYTDRGLMEIGGLASRREYNLSMVRSRQVAEQIIRSYASEKGIEYIGLADTIEELYQNSVINKTSRDAFHTIRMLGNKAVHEGDDSAEDAQTAYYLLKNEVQTYMARKRVSVDRTPVRVDLPERRASREAASRSGRPNGRKGQNNGRRSSDSGSRQGGQKNHKGGKKQEQGITIYDIVRILIPILAVILLILIIKGLLPKGAKTEQTPQIESESVMETVPETVPMTEPETEPETEPAPANYHISGSTVNVRYFDGDASDFKSHRIYTQLERGTEIGAVEPVEGTDFVKFTLDGVEVVVHKDYIEEDEEQ